MNNPYFVEDLFGIGFPLVCRDYMSGCLCRVRHCLFLGKKERLPFRYADRSAPGLYTVGDHLRPYLLCRI